MNLLTSDQQTASVLDHTFILVSQERCQYLPTSHLHQVVRILLLDQAVKDFDLDSILRLTTHLNWKHPLMRLIPCLSQSLWGIYAWLVLILVLLYCSLLLASNVLNYGAMLGLFFYLNHKWGKCHFRLIHHFSSHQQCLVLRHKCHLNE